MGYEYVWILTSSSYTEVYYQLLLCLQREHEDLIRCLVLDECEDGLQVGPCYSSVAWLSYSNESNLFSGMYWCFSCVCS